MELDELLNERRELDELLDELYELKVLSVSESEECFTNSPSLSQCLSSRSSRLPRDRDRERPRPLPYPP